MRLIVGLGNPGRKYQGTRHNIGFEVVFELAARYPAGSFRRKFKGKIKEIRLGESPALLLLPTTYMNLSGSSVLAARDFYRIPTEHLLVVCDDVNLSLAQLRFRARGSAGGQKGLADILCRLGTQDVPRLRFGVGAPPPQWDVADYVLSHFRKEEVDHVQAAIQRAAEGVEDWIRRGTEYCMNHYNTSNRNSGE
jgi:PTH1 family peptidyl-tRNA hydrolase